MKNENGFPSLLERFFTQRLMAQRRVSSHTIASYRDTFRLLLQFCEKRLHKPPSALVLTDLDPPLIGAFLDELEQDRANSARSRNLRLTAIRSFYRYAAYEEPAQSGLIQRILAMPAKRYEKKLVGFLTRPEIDAVLAAPDRSTWTGRRDRAFLLVAIQTGLRLSEMTGLLTTDAVLGTGAHVRCIGKGRKERCTPLTRQGAATLKLWLREPRRGAGDILFPSARGTRLSADGVQFLLAKYVATAQKQCPSLENKRVTPHVLRHNTETPITLSHGGSVEIPRQLRIGRGQCHQDNRPASKWLEARPQMTRDHAISKHPRIIDCFRSGPLAGYIDRFAEILFERDMAGFQPGRNSCFFEASTDNPERWPSVVRFSA